jgi:hypothetical protein
VTITNAPNLKQHAYSKDDPSINPLALHLSAKKHEQVEILRSGVMTQPLKSNNNRHIIGVDFCFRIDHPEITAVKVCHFSWDGGPVLEKGIWTNPPRSLWFVTIINVILHVLDITKTSQSWKTMEGVWREEEPVPTGTRMNLPSSIRAGTSPEVCHLHTNKEVGTITSIDP